MFPFRELLPWQTSEKTIFRQLRPVFMIPGFTHSFVPLPPLPQNSSFRWLKTLADENTDEEKDDAHPTRKRLFSVFFLREVCVVTVIVQRVDPTHCWLWRRGEVPIVKRKTKSETRKPCGNEHDRSGFGCTFHC